MAVDASLPLGPGRAATAVTSAIRTAAQATGTSFNYLFATARIESDLNPSLTMKSSSAAGLFQFIDQAWLGTLKQAGPAFGYGNYANAISRYASGHYSVDDPDMRRQIMKLRNDPTANSVMAGVLTQKNAAALQRRIGRPPTDAELYVAHLLGAGGGGKLIHRPVTLHQSIIRFMVNGLLSPVTLPVTCRARLPGCARRHRSVGREMIVRLPPGHCRELHPAAPERTQVFRIGGTGGPGLKALRENFPRSPMGTR